MKTNTNTELRAEVKTWWSDFNVDGLPTRLEDKLIALIDQYVHGKTIEARIDELGSVQLEYGHRQAQTFINGEAMTVVERCAELESSLNTEGVE